MVFSFNKGCFDFSFPNYILLYKTPYFIYNNFTLDYYNF
jgi:hypothetical protein